MATQTAYNETQAVAVAGAQATMLPASIISRNVAGANIGFGVAVSQGAADKACIATGTGATAVLGITLLDRSATGVNASTGAFTADTFGVGESARVMTKGDIWVQASVAVAAGQPVYVVLATGAFTNVVGTTNVQIVGARWDTSTTAAGLAVVRLG